MAAANKNRKPISARSVSVSGLTGLLSLSFKISQKKSSRSRRKMQVTVTEHSEIKSGNVKRESNRDDDKGRKSFLRRVNSSYCKQFCSCLAVVIAVFTILGLIIALNAKEVEVVFLTKATESNGPQKGCSANSFMINDGVCDELTNTEQCLYDGGDCCLEVKQTSLCRFCTCQKKVDLVQLEQDFSNLGVKQLKKSVDFESLITYQVKRVIDVQDQFVCFLVCQDSNGEEESNSWKFEFDSKSCTCAWADHNCKEKSISLLPIAGIEVEKTNVPKTETVGFVMSQNLLSCNCINLGVKYWSSNYVRNDVKTKSASACLDLCLQASDNCTFYSFKQTLVVTANCLLFSNTSDLYQETNLPGWLSGSSDCNSVPARAGEFTKLLVSTGAEMGNDDGLTHTEIVPLNPYLECTPLDLLAPVPQIMASGGLLDHQFPLTCGGVTNSLTNEFVDHCYNLANRTHKIKLLAGGRSSAAAILWERGGDINRKLWVTGGMSATDFLDSTELVDLKTSEFGPLFPTKLASHCLVKLDESRALLTGGFYMTSTSQVLETANTYLYDNVVEKWTLHGPLLIGRYTHACGYIQDKADSQLSMAIVVGGLYSDGQDQYVLASVELLTFADNVIDSMTWSIGPTLPMAISGGSGITTMDRTQFLLVGGNHVLTTGILAVTRSIFRMECQGGSCQWTTLLAELQVARSFAVTLWVPDYLALCNHFN